MMRVPGSNVLHKAFTAIAKETLLYYKAAGRTQNAVGQYITQYDPAVTIYGSFQPVPKLKYAYMGLDLQKSYFALYVSKNVIDLIRDASADQVAFGGRRYQVQSNVEWYGVDGWVECICVDIGPDTAAQGIFGFDGNSQPGANQNFGNGNFMPGAGNAG